MHGMARRRVLRPVDGRIRPSAYNRPGNPISRATAPLRPATGNSIDDHLVGVGLGIYLFDVAGLVSVSPPREGGDMTLTSAGVWHLFDTGLTLTLAG